MLASYLGILVYFYESLHTNYGGKVRNVPHPHICKETENFRNRQDRVNNFLNRYLVKTEDTEYEMPMETAKERYIKWHESAYPGTSKEYQRHAIDQLENSKIQSYIKKSKRGNFLKGYRVLNLAEEAAEDEEYYTDIHEKSDQNINGIKSESAEELLDRLCREHDGTYVPDTNRHVAETKNDQGDETDSDVEDIVADVKRRAQSKNLRRNVNNVDIDPKSLDTNGIIIPKRVPRKKQPISKSKKTELMEFAIMGGGSDDETDSDCE